MPSDDGGFDLREAIENGANAVRETFEFLGIEREAHVCPDCQTACEASRTYDTRRAAFAGGESPSWECPDCGRHFVREVSDESHTLDLYGRGME